LIVIAELLSTLDGIDQVDQQVPFLSGMIAGLERGHTINGPMIEALANQVAALLAYPEAELRAAHLRAAPAEFLVVEVDRMGRTLGLEPESHRWQPHQLPRLLDYLPAATPLALYGRAPNWVYTAAALHAYPATCTHFDPRLGWVTPLQVILRANPCSDQVQWSQRLSLPYCCLDVTFTTEHFLDHTEVNPLQAPDITLEHGLVISGKLPYWLLIGLVVAYWPVTPWLAIYYPPLNQAVVVASRHPDYQVGQLVAAHYTEMLEQDK
jgi:CRISPR-associated protein Csx3